MDDGKELIEMVCTSYESPDDAPEDDQHDFSMLKTPVQLIHPHCFCQAITYAIEHYKGH